jgi:hypothetical protein
VRDEQGDWGNATQDLRQTPAVLHVKNFNTMSQPYRMQIEALFHLPGGRTVFAARVDSSYPDQLLQACKCRLEVDGEVRATIEVAGEMWMNPRDASGPRALWTLSTVPLESEEIRDGRCVLVGPV